MVNERKTENIVRDLLAKQGYRDSDNIIIEEQSSDNPKINKLLKSASKNGKGRGSPEFIISFKDEPKNLIVIECKASLSDHESKDRKQYAKYAVDGVLLYASYLKDDFNVFAIAVSGETEREVKISHFLWLQGKHKEMSIDNKTILDPKSLFNIVEKQSEPLKEEALIKKAIEYNNKLHSYSIPEVERCTLISSILVALQDSAFTTTFNSYHQDDYEEANIELLGALLEACRRVLNKNKISKNKIEIILREYEKIKNNHNFRSPTIVNKLTNKQEVNTILRDLIHDINEHIMPYIIKDVYDILGKFYTQFIRYAGSDSQTGLVLTPSHISDFFCDLADIQENDIVFDPCCGTGGFLVSAMKHMLAKSGADLKKQRQIKSEQLIGIEKRSDMFSHACSNMMMRGDGKSNINFGDCFLDTLKSSVVKKQPTKALLNPPYDVGEVRQFEFIENALECLVSGGLCVAICEMSLVVSTKKDVNKVKQRILNKHSLQAVLSMPNELFNPAASVVTCVMVFKAKIPHDPNRKTFLGYFKDDGYIKVKNKGRVDALNQWEDIKKAWLSCYINKECIPGLSITASIDHDDEWCSEAYIDTDYSSLNDKVFIKKIRDYVSSEFGLGRIDSANSSPFKTSNETKVLNLNTFKSFRYDSVFNISGGYYNKKPQNQLEGNIPFIGATAMNNGITSWHDLETIEETPKDSNGKNHTLDCKVFKGGEYITVSNNGSVGYAFYQSSNFTCSHDVNPMKLLNYELNPYIALFLCTVIELEKFRWNYGRKWRPIRMPLSVIKLPADKEGNPDWEFMEEYIKSLPYSSNLETINKEEPVADKDIFNTLVKRASQPAE